MKRILLPIAALGTVVMLGLIAIAQAQRGSQRAQEPAIGAAGEAAASGPQQTTEPPSRIDPQGILDAQPLRVPPAKIPDGNPLRGSARQVAATQQAPAPRIVPSANGPASQA